MKTYCFSFLMGDGSDGEFVTNLIRLSTMQEKSAANTGRVNEEV